MNQKHVSSWLSVGGLLFLAIYATLSRDAFAQASQNRLLNKNPDIQTISLGLPRSSDHASSSSTSNDASSLPDAPSPQNQQSGTAPESGLQSSNAQALPMDGSASISGTVVDTTGASIAGAQVRLMQSNGKGQRTVLSGSNGEFAFIKLPAGSYIVTAARQGFSAFTSTEVTLSSPQSYEMQNVTLGVAGATTEVTVRPTEVIAAEQIRAEEKQRVLGIVPAFYVSYVRDAAPMTSKQKFSLAAHDTLDWTTYIGVSVTAGIEQANNTYKGYGQGAAGYGKRWAAQFGDGRSSDFLSHAVFASLFHQDPRYFYQGTGTKKSRLYHAVSSAFVARSDSGRSMPNYSYLLGTMTAGALSNAYYPHADRGASLVFTNAAIGIAGRAGQATLQEFLGKRLTRNVPKSTPPSSGQPDPANNPRP